MAKKRNICLDPEHVWYRLEILPNGFRRFTGEEPEFGHPEDHATWRAKQRAWVAEYNPPAPKPVHASITSKLLAECHEAALAAWTHAPTHVEKQRWSKLGLEIGKAMEASEIRRGKLRTNIAKARAARTGKGGRPAVRLKLADAYGAELVVHGYEQAAAAMGRSSAGSIRTAFSVAQAETILIGRGETGWSITRLGTEHASET